MSDELWAKLIGIIPAMAWVVFAAAAFLSLRSTIKSQVIPRLSTFAVPGLEVSLHREELLEKATVATSESDAKTSPAERRGVLRRMDHASAVLKGGRILWVDDAPLNNRYAVQLLRDADMKVDQVESTDEAIRSLSRDDYHLVISDVARPGDGQAGIAMLQRFRDHGIDIPVVKCAARFDPRLGVDPMIFGATNRFDEVLNYAIDIMERIRFADLPTGFARR
jgi:CheY-like chemotaxis protein